MSSSVPRLSVLFGNPRAPDKEARNNQGQTPLMLAASNDSEGPAFEPLPPRLDDTLEMLGRVMEVEGVGKGVQNIAHFRRSTLFEDMGRKYHVTPREML